jgi:two-component system, chemotaxis family, protein-glutamate methylesterase/glutaminase
VDTGADSEAETAVRPARVIGIAASAGGLEPLRQLIFELPADFPAAICVVLHIPATGRSMLAPILDRASSLRAVAAENGARLRPGVVYVAPADHHLLVRGGRILLSRGPKENGVRPAADPLFRTLARSWGEAAIGVVLSGALDDGSAGAAALAAAGATVVVQDPGDALVPSMPMSAIAAADPEYVVPAASLADVLAQLARTPVAVVEGEVDMSLDPDPAELDEPSRPVGPASGFTCPECSGALWEMRDGALVRYQCRVGHTYSEEAMVEAQGASVEAALWTALEVLEERGELMQRIAARMTDRPRTERRFRAAARDAADRAALIRRALSIGIGVQAPTVSDEVGEATG